MTQRLFLRKTDKKKMEENPRLPYFTLVVPPEEGGEGEEWAEVGALWKAKSGNGYSGKVNDDVTIVFKAKKAPSREKVDDDDLDKRFDDALAKDNADD